MNCTMEVWEGLEKRLSSSELPLGKALEKEDFYRKKAIFDMSKSISEHSTLYQVVEYDEELDMIKRVAYFKNTFVSSNEIDYLIKSFPFATFGIIHAGNKKACVKIAEEEASKKIRPITLKTANDFVKTNHRHHDNVTGCKFAIGLYKTKNGKDTLIGVAICGRPVSRILDNGLTCEINRLCTTEKGNACSRLYGACCRIAKEMGYDKIITYILESESGITLTASGFTLEDACCGGKEWTGKRKKIKDGKTPPKEYKQRWGKVLAH